MGTIEQKEIRPAVFARRFPAGAMCSCASRAANLPGVLYEELVGHAFQHRRAPHFCLVQG